MFKTLLVIMVGLVPPLISLWVMRKAEQRARERLRIAVERASRAPLIIPPSSPVREYIGYISCKFNARSPYLRCAVNPTGPCEDCSHYQPRE